MAANKNTATKTGKDLWVEMSIREISTQAHFADIAYSHLDPKAIVGTDVVFSSIHSFLSHCAMVSKMLKADDGSTPTKTIGDVLGVAAGSSIHQRTFRNHLEHYDERLQLWINQFGPNVSIGAYNMGPKTALKIPGFVFVRHYDPSTKVFTFVNDDFDLSALHSEVQLIQGVADTWVRGMESGRIKPPFI